MAGDVPLDEVVYFDTVTHNATTGAVTDCDSTPTFAVYEESTDTDIGVGGNLTKRTALTGNYRGSFTASAANGFEIGKWYNVIASGTVNSVAGKAVVMRFRCVAAETTAGYSDVAVDWSKVRNATSTVALTGTTISTTQKVDVETIKTQTLTAAAGITFGVYVGGVSAAAPASSALSTANWSNTLATNLTTIFQTDYATVYDSTNKAFLSRLGNFTNHGGVAAKITFERLVGVSTTTNEPSVKFTGNGTGAGLLCYSVNGAGIIGESINSTGIRGISNSADGIFAVSTDAYGFAASSVNYTGFHASSVSVSGVFTATNASNDIRGISISGTLTTLDAIWAKIQKWLRLGFRKDAAVATDHATELSEINADGGSGAGAFANTTDALEAIRDRGDAAWITAEGVSSPVMAIAKTVERSIDDNKAINFSWPSASATVTGTVSINNGADVAVTGAIAFRETELGRHLYTIAYNAADRPSAEGFARYTLTDGTYTTPFTLRVSGLTAAQVRAEMDSYSTKLAAIQDRVSYCLTVLVGACSDAGTAAETYSYTIGGETFTADYTGLDATGNRSTTTLSKV